MVSVKFILGNTSIGLLFYIEIYALKQGHLYAILCIFNMFPVDAL